MYSYSYAQGALGDVVYAQLPEPDSQLEQMGNISTHNFDLFNVHLIFFPIIPTLVNGEPNLNLILTHPNLEWEKILK